MFENYKTLLRCEGGRQREAFRTQGHKLKEEVFTDNINYRKVKIDDTYYDAILEEHKPDYLRSGQGDWYIMFREKIHFEVGTVVEVPNITGDYESWIIFMEGISDYFGKYNILKCNYELVWENAKGEVIKRWCVLDDSYKIMDGMMASKSGTKLPSRTLPIILPYDEETVNIRRDDRFIIDDDMVWGEPEVYNVVSRNITFHNNNKRNCGVVNLVVEQTQFNPLTDDKLLKLASNKSRQILKNKEVENSDNTEHIFTILHDDRIYEVNGKLSEPLALYIGVKMKYQILDMGEKIDKEILAELDTDSMTDELKDILEKISDRKEIEISTEDNSISVYCPYDPRLLGHYFSVKVNIGEEVIKMVLKVVSAI